MNDYDEIKFGSGLEKPIADMLNSAGVKFIHASESNDEFTLDFFLPDYDVYVEVKDFHSDRIGRQMGMKENVIAVQGSKSFQFLKTMFDRIPKL